MFFPPVIPVTTFFVPAQTYYWVMKDIYGIDVADIQAKVFNFYYNLYKPYIPDSLQGGRQYGRR